MLGCFQYLPQLHEDRELLMRIKFYGSSDDYQSNDNKEVHLVARVSTLGGTKEEG